MADGGKSCVSREVCDVLESDSFLNIEGNPSPLESTVLPNTEEQQVCGLSSGDAGLFFLEDFFFF